MHACGFHYCNNTKALHFFWLCLEQLRGLHITRLVFKSNFQRRSVSVVTWARSVRRQGPPLDLPLQACMFGRPHDIPKGLSPVGSQLRQPQIEEVNAAATGAAVACIRMVGVSDGGGVDDLHGSNGMSEPSELQTAGRTGLGHHGHAKDSLHFG